MTSILGRKRMVLAVVVALALILPTAWAEGIDDFKLTRAIPADAFLAVHCRDHDGKEFINKQYERIWEAVRAARFHIDLKNILKTAQQQSGAPVDPEAFDKQWQQISDLCTSVDWGSLGKREFALGMKLSFPLPEFVVLMMPPVEKLNDSFAGLSGVLKTLVELEPNAPFALTTEEDGDTIIHKVAVTGGTPFPIGLTLARHKDVIIVGFGPTMTEQSLALLRGQGGEALALTARFKEAFSKLPPPTDGMVFTDIAKLMGQLRSMVGAGLEMAAASTPAEGEPGHEDFLKWKALPGKIIDALDMFEYEAEVTTTKGMLATTDTIAVLRDDAKSHALYPVLFGNKPLADPLKYVPKEAGEFWVTSGIDLPVLYKAVVKILREDVPNGEIWVAQLEDLKLGGSLPQAPAAQEGATEEVAQEQSGFGIEKDIIGWVGGSLISFSVPGPTAYAPGEFVFMVSVRDEAKAREMVRWLLGMIEPFLVQQNGAVVDAEIEGVEGFKSVMHPMLAMAQITKPTVGVMDGWLVVASSPEIIVTARKVAAGEAENFLGNERFLKEGIPPKGSVTSLSFTDKTKMGEELGQVLQMASGIAAFTGAAQDPAARSLLSIVSKVGRVVRKLDFYQSSASRATFDGKVVMAKSITTYREPPVIRKPKPPTETEGEKESESEGP